MLRIRTLWQPSSNSPEKTKRTSRDAPTGHKLFNFISTSFQPRRWAHINVRSVKFLKAAVSVKAGIGFALYPAFPTDDEGFTEDFYKTAKSAQAAPCNPQGVGT